MHSNERTFLVVIKEGHKGLDELYLNSAVYNWHVDFFGFEADVFVKEFVPEDIVIVED